MADFTESNTWSNVRKWETTDAVLAGAENSPDNLPISQLVNRTAYLKNVIQNIIAGVTGIVGKLLNGSTVANTYSSAEQSDTAIPSTQFVQDAIGNRAGLRNMIINGDMQINQRGGPWTLDAGNEIYTLDRWACLLASGSARAVTVSQSWEATGNDVDNTRAVMLLAMDAVAGAVTVKQRIPNFSLFNARQCTISFILKLTSTSSFRIRISQYANQSQLTAGTPIGYVDYTMTGGSGQHFYSHTFTIPTIAASYAYDDANCLEVQFIFYDDAAQNIYLTNVQLERGAIASRFETRDDWASCLKFFENVDFRFDAPVQDTDPHQDFQFVNIFYHKKRATPRISNAPTLHLCSIDSVNYTALNSAQLKLAISGATWSIVCKSDIDSEIYV